VLLHVRKRLLGKANKCSYAHMKGCNHLDKIQYVAVDTSLVRKTSNLPDFVSNWKRLEYDCMQLFMPTQSHKHWQQTVESFKNPGDQ